MTTTLTGLQDHIAAACGVAAGEQHQRYACDIAVTAGTRWLARHRPDDCARDYELFRRECLAGSRRAARRCGIVGFLAIEVLAFLLQKALHALWDWYWKTPENAAACGAIAGQFEREPEYEE